MKTVWGVLFIIQVGLWSWVIAQLFLAVMISLSICKFGYELYLELKLKQKIYIVLFIACSVIITYKFFTVTLS